MRETTPRVDRPTLVAGLVIVGLVLAAVLALRTGPPVLDADTPEGVVQRYSDAVLAGDEDVAGAYLATAAHYRCGAGATPDEHIRVVLRDTTVTGDTAVVRVTLVTSVGPLGAEWEENDRFTLSKIDDAWRIDDAPWRLTVCR